MNRANLPSGYVILLKCIRKSDLKMDQNQMDRIKWIDCHVFKVSSIESPVGKFFIGPGQLTIRLCHTTQVYQKIRLKMDQNQTDRIKWIDGHV